MNRDDAIAWLRDAGLEVSARDWVYGQTIAIGIGDAEMVPVGEPPQEIRIWPSAAYLYPDGDGWALLDLSANDNPMARYATLEEAVSEARDYVRARAVALRNRRP